MTNNSSVTVPDQIIFETPSFSIRVAEAVILSIICAIAFLGNLSMWIIICKSRSLRTITNSFLLGLSTADLFVSVINMPVTIYTIIVGYWAFSEAACTVIGYFNMLTLVTSVLSLCNISLNRYTMVCRPTKFRRIYTTRNAVLMVSGIVTSSVILSSPPLFGWGAYTYTPIQSFCFADWANHLTYAYFMIGTCFGIPFSVMSVCHFQIFRTVHNSRKKVSIVKTTDVTPTVSGGNMGEDRKRLSANKPDSLTELGTEDPSIYVTTQYLVTKDVAADDVGNKSMVKSVPKAPRRQRRAEEVRLAITLAVVVLLFVLCWLPYCVSMLMSIYAPSYTERSFHMFTLVIGYANSGCNPIVYGIMNKKFGAGFRDLYCCCLKNKR